MKRHDRYSGSQRLRPGSAARRCIQSCLAAAILLVLASCPTVLAQQEEWGAHFVRTAYVEGQVTIQRASEIDSEEALLNMPVIPGDRVWTATDGRAELQLADGMILRMDHTTKLDAESLGIPGDPELDVTVLRLWSGSVILKGGQFESQAKAFQLDTQAASVFLIEAGHYRIDIDIDGATILSVTSGLAEVVALESSVLVRGGQRTVVQPGYSPEQPFSFNTTELDEFGSWSEDRDYRYSSNVSGDYVDDSIAHYTQDLGNYGNWFYYSYYDTYLWRPYVSHGWYPYYYGYWMWCPWGYYWYSWEPWGWSTYHYGRWCHVPGYGWGWYPGNGWSGGWVNWGIGDGYVGWAPLGYDDRPVGLTADMKGNSLAAASRPLQVSGHDGTLSSLDSGAWNFIKSDGLGSRDLSQSLLTHDEVASREPMKLLDSAPVVDFRDRKSPKSALKTMYSSSSYSGGSVGGATRSSTVTATGRRYEAATSAMPPATNRGVNGGNAASQPSRRSTAWNNSNLPRSGAWSSQQSASPPSSSQPSSSRSSTSYRSEPSRSTGSSATVPRTGSSTSTGSKSYSRKIYRGISGSSSSSTVNPPGRSRSSTSYRPSSPPSRSPSSGRSVSPPPSRSPSSGRRVSPPPSRSSSSGRRVSPPPSRSGSRGSGVSGGSRGSSRPSSPPSRSSGGSRGPSSSGGKKGGKK